MGDPSPCWEGSNGPGAIITHAEWVTGAPGRSLWVPVAGVWFLLCPSQDPAQGLGPGVCLAAGLQILPCCSPASKYFLLSADYQMIGSTLEVSFLTLPEFIGFGAVVHFFFKLSPAVAVGT